MNLFAYDKAKAYDNWIDYEKTSVRYYELWSHTEVRPGSTVIYTCHPDYRALGNNVMGYRDNRLIYYIDPTGMTEWTMMNAFYKDSYIDPHWLYQGKKMLEDHNIKKIKLLDIVSSAKSCFKLVNQIATELEYKIDYTNMQCIFNLWEQWKTTVLDPKDFDRFRSRLGLDK